MFLFFCVFLVAWQIVTKEVGEIVSKMEKNMSNPMRTLQELCELDFCNVISKGDLGKEGNKVMRKIFEAG
jgi:hypothetical protein